MADSFVSGIILAAGRSSRLGRPKQLLDLGGSPVLSHVLRNAHAAGLDDLVLVLGHEAEAIRAAVAPQLGDVRIVINREFAQGQSTSLHAGLHAVAAESAAAVILLGDQPHVGPEVIAALVAAYHESGAPIILPSYGGILANPVLIDRTLFPNALAVTGDKGARDIVRAHRHQATVVSFPDRRPPSDIDTEEDYAELCQSWPITP